MAIRLDHTIVPAREKVASARFFAEIFGLEVKSGYFAQVRVNESLTLDFADEPDTGCIHHYAFHVSDEEFDAILGRVKARRHPFGSGPTSHTDGSTYSLRGGRGFYYKDRDGHIMEVMTVPETGS